MVSVNLRLVLVVWLNHKFASFILQLDYQYRLGHDYLQKPPQIKIQTVGQTKNNHMNTEHNISKLVCWPKIRQND